MPIAGTTSICQHESAKLVTSGDYDNVSWSAFPDTTKVIGTTSTFIVQPTETTRYLGVAKSCGLTYRDTITVVVHPQPVVKLGIDTTMCDGASHMLNAGSGFASYSWQDSLHSQTYSVTHAGKYSVKVKTKFGCSALDEIAISYISPPKINLGIDTLECFQFKTLKAFGNKKSHFHWSTGSTDSLVIVGSPGKFWVTVSNQCGVVNDTINVFSLKEAFIPNVVTPNGDHLNDEFKIARVGEAKCSLTIVNRWGENIFSQNQYKDSWPNNNDLPAGNYYYYLTYPGCPSMKGWIELLK